MSVRRVYRQAVCVYCRKTGTIAAKGLCRACYYRQKRSGSLVPKPKREKRFCDVDGCDRPVVSFGKCEAHRRRHYGKERPEPRPLSQTDNAVQLRKWRAEKFFLNKRYYLKRDFGITLERYWEMHTAQNGVCAICGKDERRVHQGTGKIRHLAVDHCHKTKKVRGLLCSHCNHSLGNFNDDPELLEAAAKYLRSHL